ncbi:uncharacterized protein LOC126836755 [Adelges cooleyi]|uniref:uncharacterized protein LOC126836755 n=1 Tax=Adelges cooleyi TaxID=133065 RepID=UPI00217FFE40|nr:uncharacterized protein LOC126836755 [Adelges cooleyi]
MIANICAFLLCCFAITSIIKTIESAGNQITPIRFVAQVSNEHYGRTVNKLKTFKKHPIDITSTDLRFLSTRVCGTYKDYQSKLKSRDKLEKKAQDIKCSFCVFAKSNVLYLKSLVRKMKGGELSVEDETTVKRLEEEAKIILRLLMLSDLVTGKWLWIYLLKIVAISHCENDNEPFIDGDPFEDGQLQTGVSEFIKYCKAKEYLPLAKTEADLIWQNPNISKNMFHVLRESGNISDVLDGRVLVSIEFLYLKPFWDDDQLLFKQITLVDVDWSKAKQRHQDEVAITREFLEKRTWINKPYDRLDHQHLLVKILDARFYCYLSVVLYIFEQQLTILDRPTLKRIKDVVYNFIQDLLSLTAFKDEFLVLSISELQFAKVIDIGDIQQILARVTAKANELLNDLNGTQANEIHWLIFNVTEAQLSAYDFIIGVVQNFRDYFKELTDFCLPFEYKVILHFMDVVKISTARYV